MTTDTKKDLLELNAVELSFGAHTVFKDLDLKIDHGSINVLIGSSGAGKSSTLKLLNGLLAPVSGKVTVLGVDIAKLRERQLRALRSRIGYIPQDLGLVEPASAEENVLMGSLPRMVLPRTGSWMYPKALRSQAQQILGELGLAEHSGSRVSTLSGGQRQRVAIGRTLMQHAEIILADEPVSSLDQAIAEDVLSAFLEISQSLGITLVISLHQVELAKKFADRLIGFRRGEIVFDGSPQGLTAAKVQRIYER